MELILSLILILNVLGYVLMGVDKKRARNKQWRISEQTLWIIAIFGGAIGVTIGMKHFRHKTKHSQFKIGLPVLAILDTFVIIYLIF
jgi:uncharacterized membrane protein YsdA (DUF1294 family)